MDTPGLVDKVLPSIVAAVVSGAIGLWTLTRGQRFQKEQAAKAQQFQKEQSEKAVTVERHTEAIRRWNQICWLHKPNQDNEGWANFMNEMQDWLNENRLYLNTAVVKAFGDALSARSILDMIGSGPEDLNIRKEESAKLKAAGKLIHDNSPRYGS